MRKYVRKFLVNTKGTKVQLKLLDSFAKVPDCVLIVCVCVCVCVCLIHSISLQGESLRKKLGFRVLIF